LLTAVLGGGHGRRVGHGRQADARGALERGAVDDRLGRRTRARIDPDVTQAADGLVLAASGRDHQQEECCSWETRDEWVHPVRSLGKAAKKCRPILSIICAMSSKRPIPPLVRMHGCARPEPSVQLLSALLERLLDTFGISP